VGKISVATGATVSGTTPPADSTEVVTMGRLLQLLGQLGFPATMAGAAGGEGPSLSLASTSSDLLGTFVRPNVAVSTKLLATAGIGVGNSATGSSLGTVVKKVQVFDAAGSSLGYLPVYDAIT
jgi:hypothetical protein